MPYYPKTDFGQVNSNVASMLVLSVASKSKHSYQNCYKGEEKCNSNKSRHKGSELQFHSVRLGLTDMKRANRRTERRTATGE